MSVSTDSIGASIINSLGNGSGINIDELATNLTNAETAAAKAALEASVEKTELKISGYSYIKAQLEALHTAFDQLNDASEVGAVSIVSSDDAVGFTQTGAASLGRHSVTVSSLASAQRTVAGPFGAASTELNGGNDLTLTFQMTSGETSTISVESPTPASIVSSINQAGIGISASLIDTGNTNDPYFISLAGQTGSDNGFAITSTAPDLAFATSGQTGYVAASDAVLEVNGLAVTSDSNQVAGIIPGVTMTLNEVTTSPLTATLTSDASVVKSSLQTLVATYNDTVSLLNELGSSESTKYDYSGTLSKDSIVRTVLSQIRSAVTAESSTPGSTYGFFSDIGVEFNEYGVMTFDDTKFDEVASEAFEDIVTLLSANTDNQSEFSGQPMGLAQDVMSAIDAITDSTDGILTTRTESSTESLDDYATELEELATRMEKIKERYVEQFAAMEAAVNSINSTKDYLKQQFEMLADMGKN
jgi:flagellar hook-associated protein 2